MQVGAIRERVVSQLVNVDEDLARRVAEGLGIPVPKAQPAVKPRNPRPEVKRSPPLSLTARPGDGSIRTRCIALFVAPGIDGAAVNNLHQRLTDEGAVPRFIGPRLGTLETSDGQDIDVEVTFETAPSVVFDAAVIPGGTNGVRALMQSGQALEFVKDQYRHAKTLLALGDGASLLEAAGIPDKLPDGSADAGVLRFADAAKGAQAFIDAVAKHRHWQRQTDPPRV